MPTGIGMNPGATWTALVDGKNSSPGQIVEDYLGNRFICLQAGSACSAFSTVIWGTLSNTADFQAFPVTTTNIAAQAVRGRMSLAVPQTDAASAAYFWAQIYGRGKVVVLTACNPNTPLYTTGTAGALDDTIVTAGIVYGISLEATASGTTAITAWINWPIMGVNPDSA